MVQQNKTALVTGASRGIGRAIASALANTGAHVLVHYGRSAQDAESLVAAIRSSWSRTTCWKSMSSVCCDGIQLMLTGTISWPFR